jgi:hypothetical protein
MELLWYIRIINWRWRNSLDLNHAESQRRFPVTIDENNPAYRFHTKDELTFNANVLPWGLSLF